MLILPAAYSSLTNMKLCIQIQTLYRLKGNTGKKFKILQKLFLVSFQILFDSNDTSSKDPVLCFLFECSKVSNMTSYSSHKCLSHLNTAQ